MPACRYGQGSCHGWRVVPGHRGDRSGALCSRWCAWAAENCRPCWESLRRPPAPCSTSPRAAPQASFGQSPCNCLCPPASQVRGGCVASWTCSHGVGGTVLRRGAPGREASACGPLPPTGLSLDRSHLHLLYRAPPAATWDDITAQVALELTHLYARFQVTQFSWSVPPPSASLVPHPCPGLCTPLTPSLPRYWLWYTTKTCVGGLARKAWERLRLHRVSLIALQRRRDPEQVLLQCLPRNKVGAGAEGWEGGVGARGPGQGIGLPASGSPLQVDSTLRRLLERYRGPEPSDTVEMFEGEKFFAAFERGINVDAGRPPAPREGTLGSAPTVPAEPTPCPQTVQTVWRAGCASSSTHT